MSDNSGQAFPRLLRSWNENISNGDEAGLTKRELAAFMAMQGLCADPEISAGIGRQAVAIADDLLAELAKTKGGE